MSKRTAGAIVGVVVAMSLAAGSAMAQQAGADRPQEMPAGPIKVFILAGQSNMEGHGVVSMDGENTAHGHHWFGNAESYFLIGDALGEGMKALLEK